MLLLAKRLSYKARALGFLALSIYTGYFFLDLAAGMIAPSAENRSTRKRIIAAALAYGALILTHTVSALIFSPFALLYVIGAVGRPGAFALRSGGTSVLEALALAGGLGPPAGLAMIW